MIGKEMTEMLLENKEHYVIPGEVVAHVQEDNALSHAFLMLTKIHYAKIPVLDNDSKFKGLISMPMITETMMGLDALSFDSLDQQLVKDVMETDVATVQNPYNIEEVLHLLVNNNFVPVVSADGDFTGIVTRREMMKSLNRIAHNIEKEYDLNKKES